MVHDLVENDALAENGLPTDCDQSSSTKQDVGADVTSPQGTKRLHQSRHSVFWYLEMLLESNSNVTGLQKLGDPKRLTMEQTASGISIGSDRLWPLGFDATMVSES